MSKIAETDGYIDNAAEFSKPILKYIRQAVHEECPEVTEVIKWGFPCFDYKGFLCGMTAHKHHCSFTFWKGSVMDDPDGILEIVGKTGMGSLGKIKNLDDMPDDAVFRKYLRHAVDLNDKGVKKESPKPSKTELVIPDHFIDAVSQNAKALQTFENFSNYNKKEYVEWITDAKTDTTRDRRMKQAIEWMAEGKVRNWKYAK